MSGREEPGRPGELLDFPLRPERRESFSLPLPTEGPHVEPAPPRTASIFARAGAAAADAAAVVLVVLAATLAAVMARERWPVPAGLIWAAAFALYVSFFAVVVPLVLFGRTIGMALGGLAAVPVGGTRRLAPREAAMRWVGSILTLATLGLSLLFTGRDAAAPTLADALSGRPIARAGSPADGP
ncbi:MAG: RDD family protein [Acidobacteriota bacterium]